MKSEPPAHRVLKLIKNDLCVRKERQFLAKKEIRKKGRQNFPGNFVVVNACDLPAFDFLDKVW